MSRYVTHFYAIVTQTNGFFRILTANEDLDCEQFVLDVEERKSMGAEGTGFMTVRELAQQLSLDVKTVYAAARRGEIPTLVIGRRVLIPKRWLEQKLSGQT